MVYPKTQPSQAVRQARQIFPEIRNSQAIQARNVFLPAQVEFLGPTMGAEQGILIVIVGRAVLGNAGQMGRWRGPG